MSDELLQRFLLGGLSEQTRSEIEDQALREEETFDLIEAAETELIDRYARGELDAADRAAFERRLAPLPRVQQRIAHAHTLGAAAALAQRPVVEARPARRSAWVRPLLAAAAALLAAVIGVFVASQSSLGPWDGSATVDDTRPGVPTVTYELVPGSLREARAGQLVEPAGHEWVGLALDLDDPLIRAPSTAAEPELVLESAGRGEVLRRRSLEVAEIAAGAVTWVVPAEALAPGNYSILLVETTTGRRLANYEITVR
jgi:hypothetical protein